jgi:Putative adhesin
MTTWNFPFDQPADIGVSSWPSGSVAISGEQTGGIAVEVVASDPGADVTDLLEQVQVTFDNGRLSVRGPRLGGLLQRRKGLDLTIKAPAGSACQAQTASADVALVGQLGELTVHTASGDITATAGSGPATLHTASGDIFIERGGQRVQITTASGDVQVAGTDGELSISAVSGDVSLGDVSGQVGARTVSGDIAIRGLSGGQADLATTSGDMQVMVTPGVGVYLDLASMSGQVRSDLDEQLGGTDAALEIRCRSISGDIRVSKARAAA